MKKILSVSLIVMLLLSSCSEGENSGGNVTTGLSSVSSADSAAAFTSSPDVNDRGFEALITGFSDDTLTYITDSEHKAAMDPRSFENDSFSEGEYQLSELIINNRYSEDVRGIIRLSSDGTRVVSCDVITPNGDFFDSSMLDASGRSKTIEDSEASLRRIKGSVFELYNSFGSITADMNDLGNYYKTELPDSMDRVLFDGYRFNSGSFIIEHLSVFSGTDEMGSYIYEFLTNADKYSFFGTVQSLSDDRAAVLLTDGKTLCDVPAYYTDGELKEGMEVMITLNAGTELYGSGEEYRDGFAVFHTDPEEYNTSGCGFSELAYACFNETRTAEYRYTRICDIQ